MSIVRGADGYVDSAISNLIASGDYTFLLWFKTPDVTQYDSVVAYANAPITSNIAIGIEASSIIGGASQQFSAGATASLTPTNNTWIPVLLSANETANTPTIHTSGGSVPAGGSTGTFTPPTTPRITLFQGVDGGRPCINGVKIGAYVGWNEELSSGEIADILAGNNPLGYGTPVFGFFDNAGVVDDGSGNLVSWTDVISGSVLTPTETVTVDNSDLSPHGFSGELPDTTQPLINDASTAADGASVTINFDESVTVGDGGNGGFTVNATYGSITLTPTTTLPASTVEFSTNRVIENGESLSGVFAQLGDGFEDEAGNDLASGSFSITNNSKVHKIFSDAAKTMAYTATDIRITVAALDASSLVHVEDITPDADGYVQLTDSLTTGDYPATVYSSDLTLHAPLRHIIP